MKINKLKNGRFSVTDVAKEDLELIARACQNGKSHLNTTAVPAGRDDQVQRAVREKMDAEVSAYADLATEIRRAIR